MTHLVIVRKALFTIAFTWILTAMGQPACSQSEEQFKAMQEQIGQLQKRMMELEQRNADLERRLNAGTQEFSTAKPETKPVEKSEPAAQRQGIFSKYGVDLYGYLKFDSAYDTARTSSGNFARWVEKDNSDDQFNATANQSRFGLTFDGPDSDGLETSGRVEVDFYGSASAENKAQMMMRHAYIQLDWPENDLSLLAGQTSDVISPLVPSTINYTVGWWAGDIGYRRPQLRLTKGFDLGADSDLLFQGALSRTIGDVWGADPGDTGEDSGFPTLQTRLAYTTPLINDRPATLGVSGHWGQEEYDSDNIAASDEDFDTWSVNVDLTLPLMEKLALKGEWFLGENLDAYLGGIAQGIRGTDLDADGKLDIPVEGIRSMGGWAALSLGPFDRWQYNLGASIDDPDNDDLNNGDRSQNYTVFGNTVYSINEAVLLGFEVSYWDTEYLRDDDGDSMRYQASLMYKF